MLILMTVVLVLLLGAALLALLSTADPTRIAATIRGLGPMVLGIVGVVLALAGRVAIGGGLIVGALAWHATSRTRRGPARTPGRRSTVRTAALEMKLDHDTGALEGIALAGSHEGKVLGRMGRAALLDLYREIASDPESRQLLEAYLDGRCPGWREDAQAYPGGGQRGAPRAGAMTEQEAYQILGLPAGAGAAEIRKAHRRLMQRLHPDVGGSSFLAARINEAKDVLLSLHQ